MQEKRSETIFICYLDDDGERVNAHVELIELSENWIKIKTSKNELTIPTHRVLKIKKEVKDG